MERFPGTHVITAGQLMPARQNCLIFDHMSGETPGGARQRGPRRPRIQEPICYLLGELWAFKAPKSRVNPTANHRLTLDLWLAKDNRFLNPKSSYKRILMAPPCRLIQNQLTTIVVPVFDWQLILMESRPWSPGESTFVGNFHMKFHSPGGAIILFLNPGLSISRVALWPGTNWFPRLMERTRN